MSPVEQFERAFAEYVGARHAIALCNGTATLHTALTALGVKPGDHVAVPPLTMASTTIAVLHAGGVPVFMDVDRDTWLADGALPAVAIVASVPVSLYGLHQGFWSIRAAPLIDDAAQTLRPHNPAVAFTSYSFQGSKILPLGEGGALVTNDPELARRARWFSSLGYDLPPETSKIDKGNIKSPNAIRHIHGWW